MRNPELKRSLAAGFQISKPYLFLTLNELALSIFMVLVESLASMGISILVMVVYEHVLATIVLSLLAFFFENIVGAVLVVGGLYLLLWGKANEVETKDVQVGDSLDSPLIHQP